MVLSATLKANVEQIIDLLHLEMSTSLVQSYLRSHRLKSGMTQRELADLVGVIAHHQVSQHERSAAVPSLLAALSYQAIFGVSIIELFPGAYEAIRVTIEGRLERIEKALQDSAVKGRAAQVIARKLEWLSERRNPREMDF